ncbi:MAG TPA: hypothetical protein VI542_37165 [Candidatus Tectomicrobia bacterium]
MGVGQRVMLTLRARLARLTAMARLPHTADPGDIGCQRPRTVKK